MGDDKTFPQAAPLGARFLITIFFYKEETPSG